MKQFSKYYSFRWSPLTLLLSFAVLLSACTTSSDIDPRPTSYNVSEIRMLKTTQPLTLQEFQRSASFSSPMTLISPEKVIAGKQFGTPANAKFGNVMKHYTAAYNRQYANPQAKYRLEIRYYEQFYVPSAGSVASDVGNLAAAVVVDSAVSMAVGSSTPVYGAATGAKRKTGVNFITALATLVDPQTGQKIVSEAKDYTKTYLSGRDEKIERTLYEGVTRKLMAIIFKKSSGQIDKSLNKSDVLRPSAVPLTLAAPAG